MPRDYSQEDIRAMERQHAEGYKKQPVTENEFADLYAEQNVGEV